MVDCTKDDLPPGYLPPAMLLYCILAAFLLLTPQTAAADSFRVAGDLNYSSTDLKAGDQNGVSTEVSSNSFTQRYNLSLDKTIYPNFKVAAGGLLDIAVSENSVAGNDNEAKRTNLSPFVDVTLATPFVQAGSGYRRRESGSVINGVPSAEQISESFTAYLGFTPAELPSLNLNYSRTLAYDENRLISDTQQDNLTWGSMYNPLQNLSLRYGGNYSKRQDLLSDLQSEGLSNSAAVSYSRTMMEGRGALSASYTLSSQNNKLMAGANSGEVHTPVFATLGLYGETPSVVDNITVTDGQLKQTPSLLNGEALISIVIPVGTPLPLQPTQLNMGLAFPQDTTVNTLFLQANSSSDLASANLDPNIFTWEIYTSDLGHHWELRQTVNSAQIGSDPLTPGSELLGFILNIAPVTARFIKVAVTPRQLPPTVIPPDLSIRVTKLQAFLRERVENTRDSSSVSGSYNMTFAANLFDVPSVTYNMNFLLSHSSQNSQATSYQYGLSNGVSVAHAFNDMISGSVRVGGDYFGGSNSKSFLSGVYSAGLSVTPLPTLAHSVVLSGRTESTGGETQKSHSLSMTNTAQLYQGVSLNVSGAYNQATSPLGRISETAVLSGGVNLVPHKSLTVNVGYLEVAGKQSGGGEPETDSQDSSLSVSASYTPFPQLFFSGSYGLTMAEKQDTVTSGSYSASWSPFPGGDLQISMFYTESYSSSGDERVRVFSPNLRWNVRRGSSLTLGYVSSTSRTNVSSTELSTISATLHVQL